jgi:hypothetical protein
MADLNVPLYGHLDPASYVRRIPWCAAPAFATDDVFCLDREPFPTPNPDKRKKF